MKIGTENLPYIRIYGPVKGLERIRELGFDCIDYQQFADTNRQMFQGTRAEFEAAVLQDLALAKDNALEISQTHGPWRWPAQDSTAEERAERFEKMAMAIRGTAILESKYCAIHPIMPWGAGVNPEPDKFWAMNLDFMSRLAEVGKANGVVVCLENMPFTALSLSSPGACLDFVRQINSPWLKICLDTGHCSVLGESPAKAVRMLGKQILATMHVHDNDGVNDCHWMPYTGVIDWDDFASALQEISFDGVLSLETSVPKEFTGEARLSQEMSLVQSACQLAGKKQEGEVGK